MRDYKTWRIVIDGQSNEPLIGILEDIGNNEKVVILEEIMLKIFQNCYKTKISILRKHKIQVG